MKSFLQVHMIAALAGFWITQVITMPVYAAEPEDSGYALLVRQSPEDAGTVNPGSGVHRVVEGGTMQLVASPRPGFRFAYWLGDVADPGSMSTEVQLDSPKIVVAVYQPEEFAEMTSPRAEVSRTGGGGGGSNSGLIRSASMPSSGGGLIGGTGGTRYVPVYINNSETDDLANTGNQIAAPKTPEPTTICLLGLGGYLIQRKAVLSKIRKSRTGSKMH